MQNIRVNSWVNLKEASEILGETPARLRRKIHQGYFTAQKPFNKWYVLRAEVENYQNLCYVKRRFPISNEVQETPREMEYEYWKRYFM